MYKDNMSDQLILFTCSCSNNANLPVFIRFMNRAISSTHTDKKIIGIIFANISEIYMEKGIIYVPMKTDLYNFTETLSIKNELMKIFVKQPTLMLAFDLFSLHFIHTIFPFLYKMYIMDKMTFLSSYMRGKCHDIITDDIVNSATLNQYYINIADMLVVNMRLTREMKQHISKICATPIYNKFVNISQNNLSITTPIDSYKNYDMLIMLPKKKELIKQLADLLNNEKMVQYKKVIICDDIDIFHEYFYRICNMEMIQLEDYTDVVANLIKSKVLICMDLPDNNFNCIYNSVDVNCVPFINKELIFNNKIPNFFVLDIHAADEFINNILFALDNTNKVINDFNINLCESNMNDIISDKSLERKNVVMTTQYPGYGGAATNAYYIHKYLVDNKIKSVGSFFDDFEKIDINTLNLNPHNVPNLVVKSRNIIPVTEVLSSALAKNKSAYVSASSLKQKYEKILGGEPNLFTCKNWKAPMLVRKMYTNKKIIYLLSGSTYASYLSSLNMSAQKILRMDSNEIKKLIYSKKNWARCCKDEQNSIEQSTEVWPNSSLSMELFKKFYREYEYKITILYNTVTLFKNVNINEKHVIEWKERKYDIGFVSTSLSRTVKNYDLFHKIAESDKLKEYSPVSVGDNSKITKSDKITYFPLLQPNELFEVLGNTKIIICTSYFDASPNVLVESKCHGCEIILSKNVGGYQEYKYICEDVYDVNEWVDKILFILNK
jgi:hypothetical protein